MTSGLKTGNFKGGSTGSSLSKTSQVLYCKLYDKEATLAFNSGGNTRIIKEDVVGGFVQPFDNEYIARVPLGSYRIPDIGIFFNFAQWRIPKT